MASHLGGKLSLENHRKLMRWGILCLERILSYYGKNLDEPLIEALKVAQAWQDGNGSTGDAIKASRKVHSFAKTIDNPVAYAVARAIGQGVATAHMADHCIGAALYAQKTLKVAGKSYKEESDWQMNELVNLKLPLDLITTIKRTIAIKAKGLGL